MEKYGNTVVLSLEIDGWLYSILHKQPTAAMSPGGVIFSKGGCRYDV